MDLLTVAEAAEALRVSPSMVRKLCKQDLPFVSIGTRKLVRRSDLEVWIAEHVQKTA